MPESLSQPVERRAARVLLLDGADRVLLFQGHDPDDAGAGSWWFTPGGGLEGGESAREGAARELAEETGLQVAPDALGPVVHSRVTEFAFGGTQYRQAEDYFLVRVERHEVDTRGFVPVEVASVIGHRWWTRAEIAGTAERVYPEELLDLLARSA